MLGDLIKNMTMSVTQLNDYAASILERDETLQGLLVSGEISNFTAHSSGHMYFTLKDETAAIRCVMFRQYAQSVPIKPSDGAKVSIGGYVSLYRKEGQFQLYAKSMQLEGVGQLYERYEALKQKLEAEGLFAQEHKKPLPRFPRRIGVATSPTGAVIRDIINVSTRRNPNVDILLYPVAVQGQGAENEIVKAIEYFDTVDNVDVVIIGRGGGSLEDLWAFNEEALARAIYASKKPIISAVGHETDYSISDFVADLRAPTPSAAAELAVPLRDEAMQYLDASTQYMHDVIANEMERYGARIEAILASAYLENVNNSIASFEQRLEYLRRDILSFVITQVETGSSKLEYLRKTFESVSPTAALEKGYALVIDPVSGKLIRSIDEINMGFEADIRLSDGSARAVFTGHIEEEK